MVFSHAHEPGAGPEKVGVERDSPGLAPLMSLAEAVDRRKGSPANSRRVARYAERLARGLNLPEEHVERVRVAALLRDVGEVGVAESILGKAGSLTDEEREELERHPEIGARIVGAAQIGRVDEWILTHHERPDGNGYPRGLSGHQIPLEGKILAVADAYAAMTAARPYRRPFSSKRAFAELQARAGSQFDHEVVEVFLSLQGELELDAEPADEASARTGALARFRPVELPGQLDEVVERRRVGERVAAGRLLRRACPVRIRFTGTSSTLPLSVRGTSAIA